MNERRPFLLVFVTVLAVFLATCGGRLYVNDSHIKLMTARSIVDRGGLAIPVQSQLTVVSPQTGYSYSKFGVLHSLLFVPASLASKLLVAGGLVPPELRFPMETFLASLLSPFCAALAAGILYLWAFELFHDRRRGMAVALLFAFATMLWPYAKRSWSEMPQTLFLVAAAWTFATARARGGDRRILAGGFLLGCATALRITGVVLVPVFALFLVLPGWRDGRSFRRLLLLGAGFAAAALPLIALVNQVRFGSVSALYSWRAGGFTTPFLDGFLGLLFSPGESLFLYSPVLVLALRPLPALWRRDRGTFALACGVPASLILLYSPWWFHAYTWGPRFLLPAIPFLLLPVALFKVPERPGFRAAIALLVALSFFVQVLGVAVHLGDLSELGEPLIRNGWLPPDRELTRLDTWNHPLRTRLASHLLVFKESVPALLRGEVSSLPVDLWMLHVRKVLGVPAAVAAAIELILVGFAAWGTVLLARLWRESGRDQRAGSE